MGLFWVVPTTCELILVSALGTPNPPPSLPSAA
jgi:hypothetical protein